MNSCDQDILSLYLEGALTLPQRIHLEGHLRSCERCANELGTLRQIDQVVASWGEVRSPVPANTSRRVLRSVERKRRLGPLGSFGRMVPAAFGTGIAALLVLVSVNTGIVSQNTTPPPSVTVPSVPARVFVHQSARLISARRSSAVLANYGAQAPAPAARRISLEVN